MSVTQQQLVIRPNSRAQALWLRFSSLPLSEEMKTRIYRTLAQIDKEEDDAGLEDASFAQIELAKHLDGFNAYMIYIVSQIEKKNGTTAA